MLRGGRGGSNQPTRSRNKRREGPRDDQLFSPPVHLVVEVVPLSPVSWRTMAKLIGPGATMASDRLDPMPLHALVSCLGCRTTAPGRPTARSATRTVRCLPSWCRRWVRQSRCTRSPGCTQPAAHMVGPGPVVGHTVDMPWRRVAQRWPVSRCHRAQDVGP